MNRYRESRADESDLFDGCGPIYTYFLGEIQTAFPLSANISAGPVRNTLRPDSLMYPTFPKVNESSRYDAVK